MPVIVDELKEYPHLHINDMVEFQGELKDLSVREYKKLRKSILDHGFFLQIFIWTSPDGIHCILDGHQRKRVFIGECWFMTLPVQFIIAKTYQDAKQKLLVISSQYGKVTQEGFDEFTFDIDHQWVQETVHFDALPFVFGDTSPPEEESKDADPQTNRADELRETWGVELGQMWRLPSRVEGQEHRLICGDCTDQDVVDRVMGGEVGRLEFSDPPYDFETKGGGILSESRHMDEIEKAGISTFDPLCLDLLCETSLFCCNKSLILKYIELAKSKKVSWDLCFYKKNNTSPNYGGHMMTDVEYLPLLGKQSPIPGMQKDSYS